MSTKKWTSSRSAISTGNSKRGRQKIKRNGRQHFQRQFYKKKGIESRVGLEKSIKVVQPINRVEKESRSVTLEKMTRTNSWLCIWRALRLDWPFSRWTRWEIRWGTLFRCRPTNSIQKFPVRPFPFSMRRFHSMEEPHFRPQRRQLGMRPSLQVSSSLLELCPSFVMNCWLSKANNDGGGPHRSVGQFAGQQVRLPSGDDRRDAGGRRWPGLQRRGALHRSALPHRRHHHWYTHFFLSLFLSSFGRDRAAICCFTSSLTFRNCISLKNLAILDSKREGQP